MDFDAGEPDRRQPAALIVLSAASLACVGASGSGDAVALCLAGVDILLLTVGAWLLWGAMRQAN